MFVQLPEQPRSGHRHRNGNRRQNVCRSRGGGRDQVRGPSVRAGRSGEIRPGLDTRHRLLPIRVVVGKGRDWVVQLLSPSGEELGWASSARLPQEARLEARLPVTGRYLVRVLAHNAFWTAPNRMGYEIEVRPGPATR